MRVPSRLEVLWLQKLLFSPPHKLSSPSQHGRRFTCRPEPELSAPSCLSCSSPGAAPAGTLWPSVPALTPRAAYGEAIRHSVPLKKGTERNTTAQNTMLHLPFPPAPFFLFHFYKIPARLSICFFNSFPILVTAWSLPPSQAFNFTLTCLWVSLSTAPMLTLIRWLLLTGHTNHLRTA